MLCAIQIKRKIQKDVLKKSSISLMGSNLWAMSFAGGRSDAAAALSAGGSKTLSGTLDIVRITTNGGTDTFDAGTINIIYE
jgi:hypothetical protein